MQREEFIDRLKKSKYYTRKPNHFYFLVEDRLDKIFYEMEVPCKIIMSSSNTYKTDINIKSLFVKDINRRVYRVNKNSFYDLPDTEYDKTIFLYVDNISEVEVIDPDISKEINQYFNISRPSSIEEVMSMVDHLNNVRRLLRIKEISYSEIWEMFN